MPRKLVLIIDSYLDNVALIGTAVQGVCGLTPLSRSMIEDVQLCVVEGVNNVIEHSYTHQTHYQIQVTLLLYNDRLTIEITDNGKGMDADLLQFVVAPDVNDLPEGGWGLYIIKTKMDEVSYSSHNHINTLRLTKLFIPCNIHPN